MKMRSIGAEPHWAYPPSHGLGEGVSEFFVQIELPCAEQITLLTAKRFPLHAGEDQRAWVSWTDGVANAWCEEFPSLSAAFGRIAMLVALAEQGWERCLTTDAVEFTEYWKACVQGGSE